MKTRLCKLLSLAALAMLIAIPAAANDSAVFQLDRGVQVGSVALPVGVYMFRVSDRGVVTVLDEENANIVAVALTQRQSLKLGEGETAGTLSLDWTVRTLALGDFKYSFSPGKAPVTVAARPDVTTVIALAR